MPQGSLFGATNMDPFGGVGWSYAGDNSGAIAAGVIVDAPGDTIDAIKVYLPYFTANDASASGIRAYLYEFNDGTLTGKTLKANKVITSPAPGWNTITLTTPIADTGKKFLALVYFPWGGFTFKSHGYDTDAVSPDDADLIGQSSADIAAINSSLGNGVFVTDTISDPANPPVNPTLSTFNATNYGVDVLATLGTPSSGPPANTVAPAITTDGTPNPGELVSCSTGTWTNNPTSYSYQWQRSPGTNIAGATSSTYTIQAADTAGLRCIVTAVNASGSDFQASGSVTPVLSVPSNTGAPAITTDGTPQTGETVLLLGRHVDRQPRPRVHETVETETPASGLRPTSPAPPRATTRSRPRDEGATVKCTVTAANASGSASQDSGTISPTAPPAGAPSNQTAPAITGTAQEGQTLTCSTGTWTNSPTGYAYQWKRGRARNVAGRNLQHVRRAGRGRRPGAEVHGHGHQRGRQRLRRFEHRHADRPVLGRCRRETVGPRRRPVGRGRSRRRRGRPERARPRVPARQLHRLGRGRQHQRPAGVAQLPRRPLPDRPSTTAATTASCSSRSASPTSAARRSRSTPAGSSCTA
jgi:hypothetical protein